MSDYEAEVSILRGKMATMLASNSEQFVYVVTEALSSVDMDDALAVGQLGDDADPNFCVVALRDLANKIEEGEIT